MGGTFKSMKWVIFRHGDKQKEGFDPGLTELGIAQSQKIIAKVKAQNLPKPSVIYVSTKKRAIQTLEPLATAFGMKPIIKAELTERVSGESVDKFKFRIQEFLVKVMLLHKDNEAIYFCTHYDWIEEFLNIIESDSDLSRCTHWPSAQHMVFEKKDLWSLIKYEGL